MSRPPPGGICPASSGPCSTNADASSSTTAKQTAIIWNAALTPQFRIMTLATGGTSTELRPYTPVVSPPASPRLSGNSLTELFTVQPYTVPTPNPTSSPKPTTRPPRVVALLHNSSPATNSTLPIWISRRTSMRRLSQPPAIMQKGPGMLYTVKTMPRSLAL